MRYYLDLMARSGTEVPLAVRRHFTLSSDGRALYYLGHYHYLRGDYEEAVTVFARAQEQLDSQALQQERDYYHALALLAAGREGEAQVALDGLAGDPDHAYAFVAKQILEDAD